MDVQKLEKSFFISVCHKNYINYNLRTKLLDFFPLNKSFDRPFFCIQQKVYKEPSFVLYSANMLSSVKKVIQFQGHESSINVFYHVQMIKYYFL